MLPSSIWVSLIAELVKKQNKTKQKKLPAMQQIPVRFLSGEDPLEKGRATHSSTLGFPLWLSW